jgi:phosphoribosyl 1,2-cyclic phosphate phosphodiesterase
MRFTILGSGGAIPVPRPLCQCTLCRAARKNIRLKRNSCSAYIKDIFTLIDCPEDIGDSLNRFNVKRVDNLLVTHWHPDHTFGLRVLLESQYDFLEKKANRIINIYIAKRVYDTLRAHYPAIDYYVETLKVARIRFVDDGDEVTFTAIMCRIIGYEGKNSDWYAYLFTTESGHHVLYAPCDTIHFTNYTTLPKVHLLIHECGIFSYDKVRDELSFPDMLLRLTEINPQKTILVHLEEIELQKWGLTHLEKLTHKHQNLNIQFAYDGMVLIA